MSLPPDARSRALTRRTLFATATAGAAAPVLGGLVGPALTRAEAAALPQVSPRSSQRAWESFGVCAFPTWTDTVYRYRSAWVDQLASLGVSYIRGAYGNGSAGTYDAVRLLRSRGMRWGMPVVPSLDLSDDALRAKIADISAKAADVCLYVEGINEPNHSRTGAAVPRDWKQRTLHKQEVLWRAVKSHPNLSRVKVLGPSLQSNVATASDYKWFADNGLPSFMTHAGSHCYPAGAYPDARFSSLGPMQNHWHRPVWITETGYNNALATKGGTRPVPEDVAGVYAPSVLLEAVDRGWSTTLFEALDSVDPGAKDDVEANYGLLALRSGTAAPPWRLKPAAAALKTLLVGMKDPGPAYTPAPMGLRVTSSVSDLRWTLLGKRDGTRRLYLRRSKPVYDPNHKTRLNVPAVPVTITSAKGTRSVSVGARVVTVVL